MKSHLWFPPQYDSMAYYGVAVPMNRELVRCFRICSETHSHIISERVLALFPSFSNVRDSVERGLVRGIQTSFSRRDVAAARRYQNQQIILRQYDEANNMGLG